MAKAKAPKSNRLDGWSNFYTKLEYAGKDKRTGAAVDLQGLDYQDLRTLYRGDDMAARIVDLLPREAMREGFDVRVEEDEDMSEELENELKRVHATDRVLEAVKTQRLFGGAVILLGVNDGEKDLSKPLDESKIQALEYLTVFDPSESTVVEWQRNPLAPDYGTPLMFQMYPRTMGLAAQAVMQRVHASRCIWIPGMMSDRKHMLEKKGYGDSVLERPYHLIRDFGLNWATASVLVQDFAQAVFKMTGLAQAMAADKENLVINRMAAIELSRAAGRPLLLDAGEQGGEGAEEFERKSTPVTGLPELLDKMCLRLAAAAEMPVALLMGQAPAGLNATGAADVQFWYNNVKTLQMGLLNQILKRITCILCLAKQGPAKGVEQEFTISFRPLWQPSEKEQADTRLVMAQADSAYIAAGVLNVDEVKRARFGGDKYSIEIAVDADSNMEAPEPGDTEETTPRMAPDGSIVEMSPGQPLQPPSAGGPKAQDSALNGAQVASALSIVQAVAQGQLPRDTGVNMLVEFFYMPNDAAERVMGSVGAGFKAPEPPAPAQPPDVKK